MFNETISLVIKTILVEEIAFLVNFNALVSIGVQIVSMINAKTLFVCMIIISRRNSNVFTAAGTDSV